MPHYQNYGLFLQKPKQVGIFKQVGSFLIYSIKKHTNGVLYNES